MPRRSPEVDRQRTHSPPAATGHLHRWLPHRLTESRPLRIARPCSPLLGEEACSRALAGKYIESPRPPAHFNLDRYPHAFAAFARDHYSDAFAADLALLEAAIAETFMGEESDPLPPSALAGLEPEAFGVMTLRLRPASRLLRTAYPVNFWLEAQRAGNLPPPPEAIPDFLYVYRHHNEVRRAMLCKTSTCCWRNSAKLPVADALDAVIAADRAHASIIAARLQSGLPNGWKKVFCHRLREPDAIACCFQS